MPLGMPVEVVSERPGDAATLKLLRSVFMKGIAAAAIESLEAAEAAGRRDVARGAARRACSASRCSNACSRAAAGTRRAGSTRWRRRATCCSTLGIEPRVATASAAVLAALAAAPQSGGR